MAHEERFRYVLFHRDPAEGHLIVNSPVIPADERAACPYALEFTFPYDAKANGMPERADHDRICDFEQQLCADLGRFDALHAGHITGQGQVRILFYTQHPIDRTFTFKTGLFKKIQNTPTWTHDPEWRQYVAEYEPSRRDARFFSNDLLLRELAKHGDDPTQVRQVDFGSVFNSMEARQTFADRIRAKGWTIDPFDDEGREPNEMGLIDYWCEAKRDLSLDDPELICSLCMMLEEEAEAVGGEFDGWACHIMTQSR